VPGGRERAGHKMSHTHTHVAGSQVVGHNAADTHKSKQMPGQTNAGSGDGGLRRPSRGLRAGVRLHMRWP